MKQKISTFGLIAGLLLGFAPIAAAPVFGDATITNTGPGSENIITLGGWSSGALDITNDTDIDLDVAVDQDATSGNARVTHNTEGGDAESGDADNESAVDGEIAVENDNAGDGCNNCGSGGDVDASIDTTGPGSSNIITVGGGGECASRCGGGNEIDNDTDVDLGVEVDQSAETGNARVQRNTSGGDATTGAASNDSSADIAVEIANHTSTYNGCGCAGSVDASIDTTGPDSSNVIMVGNGGGSGHTVTNTTDLGVSSSTVQSANTGNASVNSNTSGGSASSGSASNSSTQSFSFSVSN